MPSIAIFFDMTTGLASSYAESKSRNQNAAGHQKTSGVGGGGAGGEGGGGGGQVLVMSTETPPPPSSPPLPKRECYTVGLNNTIQYEQGRSVVDCWPHTRYNTKHYPVPTPHVSKQPPCFETTLVTKHRAYTIIEKERKKILIPIPLYAMPL